MKKICVFCASTPGHDPIYMNAAKQVGEMLALNNIDLVYGGAQVGLMGAVADAVMAKGGQAIGVIPHFLSREEIAHHSLTELIKVDSMHQRKTQMAELADGFITLPGGYGTLEELCEIVTWAQLGLHKKPIGLLNLNCFYDHFIAQLDHMVQAGLLRQKNRDMLLVADTPETLLQAMQQYQAPDSVPLIETDEQT